MSYPPGQQPPTWGQTPPPAYPQPPTYGQPNYNMPPGSQGPWQYMPSTKSGPSPLTIAFIFIGALVAIVAVAAVFIFMSAPPPPTPPCPPGLPCAPNPSLPPVGPGATPRESPGHPATRPPATPSGTAAPTGEPTTPPSSPAATEEPGSTSPAVILGGSSWRSDQFDVGFEFDASLFTPQQLEDDLVVLNLNFFDAQVVVEVTDDGSTPAEMIQRELATVDTFMIGRTEDKDDYDQVLGPSLGFVSGDVKVYSGILTNSDGTPAAPGGVTIMAANNGRVTAAIVVIVADPDSRFGSDTAQYVVRTAVDDIVKTFDWGGTQ
jgi:hypothetical protein